jgi:hypothetical protein
MQVEQGIQKQILEYLRWRHIVCWKNNTAGIYVKARNTYIPSHAPGVSDILGVLPGGRFLGIEVKAPKGRVSPHQQQFIDTINQAGGLAFVAYSVDDVEQKLYGKTDNTKSTEDKKGIAKWPN